MLGIVSYLVNIFFLGEYVLIWGICSLPLCALRGGGVSQGLGRSSGFGANLMGFARGAKEAWGRVTGRGLQIA